MDNKNTAKLLEEKLFSRNFTKFGFDMNPIVSIGAGLIVLLFSLYALLNLDTALIQFENMQASIIASFDWLFILASAFFIIVCLYLAFSKIGQVRLGGVDAKPEFSNFAWYSMLLSAGMGIGLIFWSVGEPLFHMMDAPPIYTNGDAATSALATSFFHWGIHPWSIYALISVALAFFAYNKGLPLSLRSVFYPIFKEKTFGVIGDIIDILAVVACLFGLATSLGFGVQQINSGLNYLVGIEISSTVQIILIAAITLIATLSIVSGLDKGVKKLSELNIKIAFGFMLAMFLIGPTLSIVKLFINSLGLYLNDFVSASLFVDTDGSGWQGAWSVFYLSWWISWSPFVGTFIARVSKGRTIKEFILAVMIVPSLLSFMWLSVFGGTALFVDAQASGGLLAVASANLPVAMFEMISYLNTPVFAGIMRTLLSIVGTLLIISFFVTSSDSGSLVVDNLTSGGKLDSPVRQRVFWAVTEGLIASILLLVGGEQALSALQAIVISTGLPFAILLTVMGVILIGSLHQSYKAQKKVTDVKQFKKVEKLVEKHEEQHAS